MTDNISAYNLRLAKAKRKVWHNAYKWGLNLTRAEATKQAITNLRLANPELMRKARNKVKNAIKAQGIKLSDIGPYDISMAAKELIRQNSL